MKNAKILTALIIVGALVVSIVLIKQKESLRHGVQSQQQATSDVIDEKIYVAIEGDGKVAVLDPMQRKIFATIDLSDTSNGQTVQYMAHNVQVAPNGKSVWVTANAMSENTMKNGHGGKEDNAGLSDQVIVIDPLTDQIIKRIPIAVDSHLAHVVISPDSQKAYVTLQETGALYTINTNTFAVEDRVDLGKQSGPHGLRVSQDGTQVFVAYVAGKAFAVIDTKTNKIERYQLESEVVQAAVTLNGQYAFMSLYRTKQIGRFDMDTQKIEMIDLPKEAKGPVQLYPTPDSRFLYVADQGHYFDQPTGDKIYRIDIALGIVDQTITAGNGPHGVVVDTEGKFVYISNLLSDDVSIIDIQSNKETARIPVGDMPNGISVWHRLNGGTP